MQESLPALQLKMNAAYVMVTTAPAQIVQVYQMVIQRWMTVANVMVIMVVSQWVA